MKAELIAALQQDLADAEYLNEIAEWDSVAGDRIAALYNYELRLRE